jgi:hypothetical protein
MEGDERGFRVALVADELVNPPAGGIDGLAVLEEMEWGIIHLPSNAYERDVAGPLLEQVAEQAEEFVRHGYTVAVIGGREGLDAALAAFGISGLPAAAPATAGELRAFLTEAGAAQPR